MSPFHVAPALLISFQTLYIPLVAETALPLRVYRSITRVFEDRLRIIVGRIIRSSTSSLYHSV